MVNGIGDAVLAFRGPLIRDLVAAGHRVLVSTPEPECADVESVRAGIRALGAEVVFSPLRRTSMNPFAELRARRHWRELIAEQKPDAIFASNPKPVFHALTIAAKAGVPRRVAMITGLGYAFIGRGLRAGLVRAIACVLYRRAMQSATAVFFQNGDDLGEFRERQLLPPSLSVATVGGSGVDLAAFPQRELPSGPPVFLMIARLLGDKGVREFAAAARAVRAKRPECAFRLVGWIDGNPAAIRPAELEAWTREGILTCTGRLDDVREELARCHAFVLPSYREGMPRSTLEALATGRAVITTDVPGCRETVVPGANGLIVPARDAESLTAACLRLADDPALLRSMGAASRSLAERRFDAAVVNATLLRSLT